MNTPPELIIGGEPPRYPFSVEHLPLIAKLCRVGFHRYRRRWAKRLLKRPARILFDVAYHCLRLGGDGTFILELPEGPVHLRFNARQLHFRSIYDNLPNGHEPEVASILETLLTADRVFYDVGANWGYFSHYAATIRGYRGAIHAFEPIPETFADLDGLIRQAGLEGRISRHPLALSDRDGDDFMAYDPMNSGLARFGDAPGGHKRVQLARLDGLGLPAPWLIKMDVENHEFQALKGGASLIRRNKPFVVFENWIDRNDPPATLRPLRYLESLGYVLYLPVWHHGRGENGYVWPEVTPPGPAATRRLALLRFPAAGRFQFADQINALACHRDRTLELVSEFSAGRAAEKRE